MKGRTKTLGFTGVAVMAALVAALSVSPAAAAPGAAHADECGLFDSLSTLTNSAAAARGDDAREPVLNETYEALPESARGKGGPRFKATIPVYFHVVSPDGVVGNVTQAQIDEQIAVMNLSFSGFYGGAKTGFKFTLAGVTRSVNADWFNAGPGSPDERAMKKALTRGGLGTLNYYSTTAGPYLGWAYLPGLTPSRQYLDGIVVDWESMVHTSTRYEGRYDLGLTAVHEAGHWLNLEHTFYGGCNANGDFVADTPAMKVPTSGCPADGTKDTCVNEPGL
ncbi:MAG: zinc metalloprotease, partial [Gaiellaceae bacterium]